MDRTGPCLPSSVEPFHTLCKWEANYLVHSVLMKVAFDYARIVLSRSQPFQFRFLSF
ncbi:hypothetical protein Pint_21604 [Pistacia integerrima]|uniref:Uncharacterized protein n=1 Tax=Pistacia integerrima TaxID=434235 RepID=A0ACC0XBT1_9ROSI|nr:hypothetical protein Pint_21604 [Pistacia integerrima]